MGAIDLARADFAALGDGLVQELSFLDLIQSRDSAIPCDGAVPPSEPVVPVRARAKRPERIRVFAARSDVEIGSVAGLLEKRYQWRGYAAPMLKGAEQGTDAADCSKQVTLVAKEGDVALGTLTIGIDSSGGGLYVEHCFPEEVSALRERAHKLAELTRLAVDHCKHSRAVLAALFQSAYFVCRVEHNASDVLIEVNPRHVAFYRRAFGFRPAAQERTSPRVGASSILMHLEMTGLDRRLGAFGAAA
jgi:hypothetical protein